MPTAAPGRPARRAAIAFAVLAAATVGAFFAANQLKSQPPLIDILRRSKFFSPDGDGRRDKEEVRFSIDADDTAAVDVVDIDGTRVRRVATKLRLKRGRPTRVVWDGRTDDGDRAPDGEYRLRLLLRRAGSAVLAPKSFFVDTVAPRPQVAVDEQTPIVMPGDPVAFAVSGEGEDLPPRFAVLRTDVSPPQKVRSFTGELGRSDYIWNGRTDAGTAAEPGTYLVAVTATDKAGNEGRMPSLPLRPGEIAGRPGVTVRALAVQPPVRPVRAGDPASFRVDAREQPYSWALRRLGTRKPVLRGRRGAGQSTLVVRPPRGPSGVFLLEVSTTSASTTVPLAVDARTRVGPLIVLPMISWLGRDPVDQTLDGVPDTLTAGSAVRYPRPFAYPTGMPPGLLRDVRPLLTFLDRAKLRYALTTDLALSFTDDPQPDQKGVIFAGTSEWVSRSVAAKLRDYVSGGGKLTLFGPRALRASVAVADSVLSRPSPLTPLDALGGRIADVRRIETEPDAVRPPLTVLAEEDPGLGLLEGFSGELDGFDQAEELLDPGPGKLRTGVGVDDSLLRPALSAVSEGDGLVIRVGLPDWGPRLRAGDDAVEQITRNLVDILRGVQPRTRTAGG